MGQLWKKVLKGIGLVTAVSVGEDGQFCLGDYRIYAKQEDGKSKIKLAREIIQNSNAKIVLFDAWYASKDLMNDLQKQEKVFYSTLPSSRVFYDTQNHKHKLKDYEFTEQERRKGKIVQLNKMNFQVRIFRSCSKKGQAEIIVTNDIAQISLEEAEKMFSSRPKIEEFHREIKQLTGIEKCQARISRIQRNHICCCLMAWQFLKNKAKLQNTTVYELHSRQFNDFVRSQLVNPSLKFA